MTFTNGLEQLIHTLGTSDGRDRIVFPPRLGAGAARRSAGEPAHIWLGRCAEEMGGIESLAVEENLALILVLRMEGGKLEYANLQALWTEVSLAEFAAGDGQSAHRYLRVDHDPSALGPLLKEPLPHVHVEPDGEPRLPLPPGAAEDVVGWFIDFIYRNFFYEDWIAWAEMAWDEWCVESGRINRWQRLVQVFKQSKVAVLEADPDLREDLRQLKRCMVKARRGLFPIAVDATRAELFGHDASSS